MWKQSSVSLGHNESSSESFARFLHRKRNGQRHASNNHSANRVAESDLQQPSCYDSLGFVNEGCSIISHTLTCILALDGDISKCPSRITPASRACDQEHGSSRARCCESSFKSCYPRRDKGLPTRTCDVFREGYGLQLLDSIRHGTGKASMLSQSPLTIILGHKFKVCQFTW